MARAGRPPGILAVGVAAMSEELDTESNRSVGNQTEMPLPSELSTSSLGAYSRSRCSPRSMRRGRSSCPLSYRSSFICSWLRPCACLSG
jgi:hypothetical protein